MMCYMDMTFCKYWEKCANGKDCPRALNEKVIEGAKKWAHWTDEPPICVYTEKPDCFVEKEGEDD